MESSVLSPAVLLFAAVAIAIWSALVRPRPGRRRRALDRFARKVGLPVPAGLRADLERRLLARNLAADRGVAAGIAVVALYGLTVGHPAVAGEFWMLIVAGTALTGLSLGVGFVAIRESARPRPSIGARVARPTAPAFGDYVAPVELWGGRIVGVLPLVLLLGLLAASTVTALDVGSIGAAVGAGLGILVVAAAEVGGRRLLEAPQAAESDVELAWSDAVRARALRDIVTAPIAVGTYATIGVLRSLRLETLDPPDLAGKALVGLLALVLVAAAAVLAWSATTRPHRHFRRRLWPALRTAPVETGASR